MKDTILIEVAPQLKPLADTFRALVAETEAAVDAIRGSRAMDYVGIEASLAEAAAAMERAGHECVLGTAVPSPARIRVGGRTYRRLAATNGHYKTKAGVVTIERPLYREEGVRNGETVDPVALRVGAIADGWLPGCAKAMAFVCQQQPSREASAAAMQLDRLPYSRSSFERVPHHVGRALSPHQAEIEDELIEELEVPRSAASVSVSADRCSIAMEEPRARPVGRPRKDAPKRPISRQYRMAWVGTVTLHDRDGESLRTIRYGRMPGLDGRELGRAMEEDVLQLLRSRPDLKVAKLADGGADVWDVLDNILDQEVLGGRRAVRLIDFWHVIEKLGAAAKVLNPNGSTELLQGWRNRLRKQRGAALAILEELRQSGMDNVRVGDSRPVHEAITYLENHHTQMNYPAARKAGLPIGSGNVEATCKSLVGTRMKRPGSRWKVDTGNHMLQLRALGLSDRFDAAMGKLFRRLAVPVRAAA